MNAAAALLTVLRRWVAHSSFAAVQNQPVFGHGDVLDRHGASVAAWRADNDCTSFTGVSVHDEALELADWLSRVAANRQSLQGEFIAHVKPRFIGGTTTPFPGRRQVNRGERAWHQVP